MDINELYKQQNYPAILDSFLETVIKCKYKRNSPKINSQIDMLVKTLYSCFHCGAYSEVLELLDIASTIDFVDWNGHRADFLYFEFDALLYYLFNNDEYSGDDTLIDGRINDIIPKMEDAFLKEGITLSDNSINLIKLFRDYKDGLSPYYVLEFLYPYAPPFGEGVIDLQGCGKYLSLSIKAIPREHDTITSFSFKIEGYTHEKLFWPGHTWKNKERFPIVKKVLPLLNLILLRSAGANPGVFIPLYNVEQVSSAHTNVYAHDGTLIHGTIFETRFDTQWSGGNVLTHVFSEQEFKALSEDVKQHYDCTHYFIQFHQARNNMNAGLYVESFLLFCTCAESMLYNECNYIASLCNKQKEFMLFCTTKQSRCKDCEHFKKLQELEEKELKLPDNGIVPSVFSDLDFLTENCGVSKDDVKN